ncbi:MAG: Uncharacterised protein [Methanobacteriota archaeon]|jgi:hypothetical protein|nr:MAG: Uncharacterised protein [Euryarchaeota archaeon]|tara:strand:+ start:938 stop:1177 length:240 start_codon:yes stop_codon:yes gene_type:complete
MLADTMGEGSKLNKGERIPRRPLPEFREVNGGVIKAITEDGLLGTALEDKNQYGPHAMIILLMIVATVTGGLLLLLRML